jgi:uncharacterized protein DUF1629
MSSNSTNKAYILDWELSHLGDDEFDAVLVKFPGWEDSMNLLGGRYSLPSRIFFEANFRTLSLIDYPYNDVFWPIMSKRMLNVLIAAGHFKHEPIPITMIKDTIKPSKRYDSKGAPLQGVENHDFMAVRLLEELDAFDWEHSVYRTSENIPNRALRITKWVLKKPGAQFPPIFRISAHPTKLFISSVGREALESAGLKGMIFEDLDGS